MQELEIQVAVCMKLNFKCQIKSELEYHDSFQYTWNFVYMEFWNWSVLIVNSQTKGQLGMYSRPKKTI